MVPIYFKKPLLCNRFSPLRTSITMPKATSDPKPADDRLKRKGSGVGTKQSKKAAKDPNNPMMLRAAFFVFMDEFKEMFKKKNPNNKCITLVGKAGAMKWNAMSAADKAPYIATAEKLKEEYEKTFNAYIISLAEGKNPSASEGSDKSKSEVNDEDDD